MGRTLCSATPVPPPYLPFSKEMIADFSRCSCTLHSHRSMARQVGQVPPCSAQERRVERRGQGLDTEELVIRNIVIQQAPKTRRRTYRAHGRINPYEGHPIHAEILLAEPAAQVPKAASSDLTVRLNKRQLAQKRITAARATKA